MVYSRKRKNKYEKRLRGLGAKEIADFFYINKYILLETKESSGLASKLYEEFKEKHKDYQKLHDLSSFINFLRENNIRYKCINYDYFLFLDDAKIRNSTFALILNS